MSGRRTPGGRLPGRRRTLSRHMGYVSYMCHMIYMCYVCYMRFMCRVEPQ